MIQGSPLGYLYVDSHKEIGEKLNIEKLAPGGAQIKDKLVEYLFVYLHSQQFEGIMGGHFGQSTQILVFGCERDYVDRLELFQQEGGEVIGSYLFAFAGRHHTLVGEAFRHLFDPVIESRY